MEPVGPTGIAHRDDHADPLMGNDKGAAVRFLGERCDGVSDVRIGLNRETKRLHPQRNCGGLG